MLLLSSMYLGVATAQPSQGNWIVAGVSVVQNETVNLNGNLTVESGGSLTLRNVNLAINVQSNGQYGIGVNPGGSLYVYGSRITSSNHNYRFTFDAYGSNFVMKNSTVEGAGWCQASSFSDCLSAKNPPVHVAVLVGSNGADIENSMISNGAIGLILTGNGDTIRGNVIEQNDFSPFVLLGSSGDEVASNTFYQSPTSGASNLITLNRAQNNTITFNTIEEQDYQAWYTTAGGFDGIQGYQDSNGNLIGHNNISVGRVAINMGSGTKILDNHIFDGEVGVGVSGVNAEVIGNTLVSVPGQFNGGIKLTTTRNGVIANNTLSGVLQGMELDHTDNMSVIDNKVTSTLFPRGGCRSLSQGGCNTIDDYSLKLFHSSNDTFLGNSFMGTGYGLLLSGGSNRNLFADDTFNATHSVTMIDSNSNLLHGNNFYDLSGSSGGPYDNGNNSWYTSHQGNYWSYFGCGQYTGGNADCGAYSRSYVSPRGNEQFSLSEPVSLVFHAVVIPNPLPIPPPYAPISNRPSTLIKNGEVVYKCVTGNNVSSVCRAPSATINSGCVPGNVTIINSTVTMATKGPVEIGGCGQAGPTIIQNSRLLDGGYGLYIHVNGNYPFIVTNSTIDGAYLQDEIASKIVVENSIITNSQGDRGITEESAQSVTIVNCTFSDEFEAIDIGSYTPTESVLVEGNTIRDSLASAVTVYGLGVTISNNTVSGSWGDSIGASGTLGLVIEGNVVSGVMAGINAGGNDALIEGNSIFNSRTGIVVSGSGDTIEGNIVSGVGFAINAGGNGGLIKGNGIFNSGYGIVVDGSGGTIYHNNILNTSVSALDQSGQNQWSHDGEGNFYSNYLTGNHTRASDPDLDGIGDAPYARGGVTDNYPFMKPNGWLTRFYLTFNTNLPASTTFQINGTNFYVGRSGSVTLRLGYVANYIFTLPQIVKLANGSTLGFLKWGDGVTSRTRTLKLSANSTLDSVYVLVASTTTTTTTSSSSSHTSTSTATTNTSSSATGGRAGIPEFPFQPLAAAVLSVLIVASYLLIRRNGSNRPA